MISPHKNMPSKYVSKEPNGQVVQTFQMLNRTPTLPNQQSQEVALKLKQIRTLLGYQNNPIISTERARQPEKQEDQGINLKNFVLSMRKLKQVERSPNVLPRTFPKSPEKEDTQQALQNYADSSLKYANSFLPSKSKCPAEWETQRKRIEDLREQSSRTIDYLETVVKKQSGRINQDKCPGVYSNIKTINHSNSSKSPKYLLNSRSIEVASEIQNQETIIDLNLQGSQLFSQRFLTLSPVKNLSPLSRCPEGVYMAKRRLSHALKGKSSQVKKDVSQTSFLPSIIGYARRNQ